MRYFGGMGCGLVNCQNPQEHFDLLKYTSFAIKRLKVVTTIKGKNGAQKKPEVLRLRLLTNSLYSQFVV